MLTTTILTLILAAHPAAAGQEFREVTVYGGLVTLEIPADWDEIPQDLLESHSLNVAEASGGRITEIYQYGFRSSDPEVDAEL